MCEDKRCWGKTDDGGNGLVFIVEEGKEGFEGEVRFGKKQGFC